MTPFTRISRLGTALACALAAAAIVVPLAQATPDPWLLHGTSSNGFRFSTENSASQNTYGAPDPWQYRFLHPTSSTGYRFITEHSASQNRLPSEIVSTRAVPVSGQGFDWLSAMIGAVAALACSLILVLLTRRVPAFGRDRGLMPSVTTR